MNRLTLLGYNSFFEKQFADLNRTDLIPGRIAVENKNNFLVYTEKGELTAEISGNLLFNSESQSQLPKVGDWVALAEFEELGIIHFVLERKSKLSRKVSDRKTAEQVLITNVDIVFIMQSANENFNLNRLERQASAVMNSRAEPVFILSKIDICENTDSLMSEINKRIKNLKIFPLSSIENMGIMEIKNFIREGDTHAIIGSSGVGKSTLINTLAEKEILKTQEIRESDSKGKHTTTRREMHILPGGGIIIDTPGLREFGLWDNADGISKSFSEFEDYSEQCKYDDCTHTVEKGCAVIQAVESGEIPSERYNNYIKLRKELEYLETKTDIQKALEKKKKWKTIIKDYKKLDPKGRK